MWESRPKYLGRKCLWIELGMPQNAYLREGPEFPATGLSGSRKGRRGLVWRGIIDYNSRPLFGQTGSKIDVLTL